MRSGTATITILCTLLLVPALGLAFPTEGGAATDCTVEALDHEFISLSDYSGQILVLFLLGTTDSRCNNAAPAYEQNVYQPYKDKGVTVLGVDVHPTDKFDDLASFRDQHGITFPLAIDTGGECWGEYQADEEGHVPVFYVIDRQGVIRDIELGYRTGREENTIEAIEAVLFDERPTISLNLNRDRNDMTPYQPGETMQLLAAVENVGPEASVVAYIAVGFGSELFFWPSFSSLPEGLPLTLLAGFSVSNYPITTIALNEALPRGLYTWYAVLADASTGEWLRAPDMITWPFGRHARAESGREHLEIPDDVWAYARSQVSYGGTELGFTSEEMAHFGGNEFLLRTVEGLFADVTEVPRLSGEIGDTFLENCLEPAEIATYCYSMVEFDTQEPIKRAVDAGSIGGTNQVMSDEDFTFDTPTDQANWESLPQQVQDFATAMVAAAASATPMLSSAFDRDFIAQSLGVAPADLDTVSRSTLYDFAAAPWKFYNPDASSFEALYRLDFSRLSAATSSYLSDVTAAIGGLRVWLSENPLGPTTFEMIRLNASIGRVCICGTGNQTIAGSFNLIVDLGGDDTYSGKHAVPLTFSQPISAIVDVAGNDTYDGGSGAAKLCCGLFGMGAVFDLAGDDGYSCSESGVASAWHGTGVLVDYQGNDAYNASSYWSEGTAHAGLGLLIDLDGDDSYECYTQGQGFGSTLGIGAVLDVDGNDHYNAIGSPSDAFGKPIAFAQGAGFGRRADTTDRRSLAGGIGIFVEGDGDDDYYGQVYSQGCAYWWSLGVCEDRGGNDTYRCLWYSLGSAPHMAIGCMVDLVGNDRYNVDDRDAVTQYQACARDGSVGVFVDGDGDDAYFHRNRCAGSADLNSIALFWDRYGNDQYDTSLESPYVSDPPYGASCIYDPSGDFRDEMNTVGVFLDTNGIDAYNVDPEDYGGVKPECAENMQWRHNEGPVFWGYGLDIDWYVSPGVP